MESVFQLDAIDIPEPSLVGRKASSLAKLIHAGFLVPPGFVISANAYDEHLRRSNVEPMIPAIFRAAASDAWSEAHKIAERVRDGIMETGFAAELFDQIEAAYERLAAPWVAVRSSATAEDGPKFAWAGILESYLGVTRDALFPSIKRCWASLFAQRAICYQLNNGLHRAHASVAVIVQRLVVSDVAGVAFSTDPSSGRDDTILIESVFGLGEPLASAQITPDSYRIERKTLKIRRKSVAVQRRIVALSQSGGVQWQELQGAARNTQKLPDSEIADLARTVADIEGTLGFPVDVEWAKCATGLHILQSRPITAVAPASDQTSPGTPEIIFEKTITRDWTLLFAEIWQYVYTTEFRRQYDWALSDAIYHGKQGLVTVYRVPQEFVTGMTELACRSLAEDRHWMDYVAQLVTTHVREARSCMTLAKSKPFSEYSDADLGDVLDEYVRRNRELGPGYSIVLWFPARMTQFHQSDGYSEAITVATQAREAIHAISDEADSFARDIAAEVLRRAALDVSYAKFVSYDQLRSFLSVRTPLDAEALTQRTQNYLVTIEGVTTEQLESYISRRGYRLIEDVPPDSPSSIYGTTAYPGVVKGSVRVITSKDAFPRFHAGEILVAPMTTPDYGPLIARALAVITDEGGTTSHAAIIARERKVPTVAGTRYATKVLHDGDTVVVDADRGVITLSH